MAGGHKSPTECIYVPHNNALVTNPHFLTHRGALCCEWLRVAGVWGGCFQHRLKLQSPRHKMGCACGLCVAASGPGVKKEMPGWQQMWWSSPREENGQEGKEMKLVCAVRGLARLILGNKPPKLIQNSIFQSWGLILAFREQPLI